MQKYIDEEDIEYLFEEKNIIIRDSMLEEIGANKVDQYGFELDMEFKIVECCFSLILSHVSNNVCILNIYFRHCIELITRKYNSIEIQCENNPSIIEFSFKPNFSLRLPELSLSNTKNSLPFNKSLQFDAQALNELFGTELSIDFKGQLFYKSTNENGFTLQMKLTPDLHKCSLKLLYEKYQEPVFEVPFGWVEGIEVYLTPGNRSLKLQGQLKYGQIKILFDHNFALDKLPSWIWRQ